MRLISINLRRFSLIFVLHPLRFGYGKSDPLARILPQGAIDCSVSIGCLHNYIKMYLFRFISMLVFFLISEGLGVFIPRFLTAIKPPQEMYNRRACIHLVSMIPFLSDIQVSDSIRESNESFFCFTSTNIDCKYHAYIKICNSPLKLTSFLFPNKSFMCLIRRLHKSLIYGVQIRK